jgi:hypothetical protein
LSSHHGRNHKTQGPVSLQIWHDKDPFYLKGHVCPAESQFCSPTPANVMPLYDWKLLKRGENEQNQSIILWNNKPMMVYRRYIQWNRPISMMVYSWHIQWNRPTYDGVQTILWDVCLPGCESDFTVLIAKLLRVMFGCLKQRKDSYWYLTQFLFCLPSYNLDLTVEINAGRWKQFKRKQRSKAPSSFIFIRVDIYHLIFFLLVHTVIYMSLVYVWIHLYTSMNYEIHYITILCLCKWIKRKESNVL